MGQQTRPSPSGWRGKGPQQQAAPFLFLLGLCCLHRRELGAGYTSRGGSGCAARLAGTGFYMAGGNPLRTVGLCPTSCSGRAAEYGALSSKAQPFWRGPATW